MIGMTEQRQMEILFSVWGNPCSWEKAEYAVDGITTSTKSVEEALNKAFSYDKVVVFAPDSLIVQAFGKCPSCPHASLKGSFPKDYKALRLKVKEFVEGWLKRCTRLRAFEAFPFPVKGTFGRKNKVTFVSEENVFRLAAPFFLYKILKEGFEEAHFNLTHGPNFAPVLLVETALAACSIKRAKCSFFIAEPFSYGRKVRVEEVQRLEGASFEALLDLLGLKPESVEGVVEALIEGTEVKEGEVVYPRVHQAAP